LSVIRSKGRKRPKAGRGKKAARRKPVSKKILQRVRGRGRERLDMWRDRGWSIGRSKNRSGLIGSHKKFGKVRARCEGRLCNMMAAKEASA